MMHTYLRHRTRKTSRSMPEFRGTHKLDAAGNPVELTGLDRAAGFSWYGLTMEVR